MTPSSPSFGVLTLATSKDYLKAIGLALSVRVSNPGMPVAVACPPNARHLLEPYFDYVIDERPGLRGFVHKVHLDHYTPFEETMFFDSDVLVFKPLQPYVDVWRKHPYTATGRYTTSGKSAFGMDRVDVLRQLGKAELVTIDGAGHAFFRKPDCGAIFDEAREVTARHKEIMGPIPYADEDVMDYVLTKFGIPPMPRPDFFSRYASGTPGTFKIDAAKGLCEFVFRDTGQLMRPCMMHFAANEAAFVYHWQIHKLFRKFGVKGAGLLKSAVHDAYERDVHLRLHTLKKRLLSKKE
jgi:hypothetical protein